VKGRKIADLNDAIEDFDRLAELIGQRIAAKGNPASPYGTNNAGKP
jgi:hypothetical protein